MARRKRAVLQADEIRIPFIGRTGDGPMIHYVTQCDQASELLPDGIDTGR
jgi:hypothetical protein